ncbi:MAG TPA: MlaD family protein [Solirubrobacteraceae bacterium]
MNRRRSTSLAGNPLLIGAVTTLIAIVAVYLSYNANNGLPFTPTYSLKAELPEAAGLQTSDDVRMGGTRVGTVDSITAHQDPKTGRLTAIVGMKLEKGVEPLPADTTLIVQSVSALGLKYLRLNKGTSGQTLKAGATIPVSQAREPVEIQDLFNMFDPKTRTANQENLNTFGDAFAGRGLGLNETIATLRPLVTNAIPVLHNLASRQTNLRGLFIALERGASEVAPVAQQQADFFSNLDTFFTAFAGVAPSLEATIEGAPPAMHQAIHSLPFEAPFIEKSTRFMALLRPSARELASAASPLGHAFAVGTVTLREATEVNKLLAPASKALEEFAGNPIVNQGLVDLTQTAQAGNPLVAGLAPAQATCNYFSLFFRNIASVLAGSNGAGTMARVAPLVSPLGPNNEGGPSSAPANGPSVDKRVGSAAVIDDNHLHSNPYPNVAAPGQPQVCEAGNQGYIAGKTVIGNVPGPVGAAREPTTRSQSLTGQTYPSATLKDLGISGSSKKAGKK